MDETLQWGNLKSRVNQGDPARLATSRAFTPGAWRGRAEGAVTDPGDPEGLRGGRPVGLEKAAGPCDPAGRELGTSRNSSLLLWSPYSHGPDPTGSQRVWVPQPVKNDGEWTRRAEGKRSSAEVRAMNTGLMRKLFSSPPPYPMKLDLEK